MQSIFDEKVDRKGTLSVKWNPAAIASISGNPDAEPFWVADMDFRVAGEIAREVTNAAESGIYGYPHFDGIRETFCAWAQRRHGWTVRAEEVTICQGLLTSIAMLTELLSGKGDGVIVPMPAYQPFVRIVENLGRKLIRWPLIYDETRREFSLDWALFEKLCDKNKLLIFCSPHNPSGLEFSEEELRKLCAIAGSKGVTIISDEIHGDLSFTRHVPLVRAAGECGARAVTCMAPSKTFNIAGEHFSVMVTDDGEVRSALERRMRELRADSTSFFSTTAAVAAYREGYPWLMDLLSYLRGNIEAITSFLTKNVPSLRFIKPRASFIGLIDCADILPLVEKDAERNGELYDPAKSPSGGIMSRFFGQRASVAVNDGTWFGGEAYRRFVRFNYGVRRENILKALERIRRAVDSL